MDINEKRWLTKIKKQLVGKTIVKIEYMHEDVVETNMWSSRPICILLDDGNWIYPMCDDEGNNGGAMGTTFEDLQTIPVFY
tara:strand:+ start:54598 stop:54840 length:243 start_codon:yes stop_codon:yes gene_type:complete